MLEKAWTLRVNSPLAPQVYSEKIARPDGIVLDPPEEIAINKVSVAVSLAMILQSIDWDSFRIPGLEVKETAAFFKSWLQRLTLNLHPRNGPG